MFAMTIFGYTLSIIWAFFIVFIWIAIAFLPATIAKNKGRGFFGWFLLSLFFWWITFFVAIFMEDHTHPTTTSTT